MAKTKLEIESDYGPVVNTFNQINSSIDVTQENVLGLSKGTKNAFDSMTNAAKQYGKEVSGTVKEFNVLQSETRSQVDTIKQLTAARKLSNDPAQIALYNKQIEAARNNIKKLHSEEKTRSKENQENVQKTSGLIETLVLKEKLLTEMRNKSNDPGLIARYNKLLDETRSKLSSLTSVQKQAASQPGFFDKLKQGILSVFGGNLLFAAVNKVREIFSDLVSEQVAFQKQLQNLSAITGASGKDLVFYGEEAKIMGKEIEGGAVAAVEAFKLIGSAKPELLKNKEALVEVTQAAVTLSQASGLTLPQAAENLGNALNAFEADAKESAKFINVLASAAQLGAKEIPFVTEALTKFGGVAKTAGVSIEESASAIEILGAKIPEASIVGTNLRGVLIVLQVEAAKQGRAFKGLGAELDLLAPKVKDITFLEKTFGKENLLAAQTLISQRGELKKLTDGVTGTNSAYEQAITNTDTLAQSILRAGNEYDGFILSLKGSQGIIKSTFDLIGKGFNELSAVTSGTAAGNRSVEYIRRLAGANNDLAKTLHNLGLNYLDASKAESVLVTFEQTGRLNIDSDTQKRIDQTRAIVGYAQGLQITIDKIKDSNNAESASLKTKALITTQLEALKDAYTKGSLSSQDYTLKLKILSSVTSQAVLKTAKDTGIAAEAVGGIIAKLQKEITDLTELRVNATSVQDINQLTVQINAKQKQLDALLGKANDDIKRAKEEYERAIADLKSKVNKARLDLVSGDERIALENKFNQEEIDILQAHLIKLGLATDKHFKLSLEQEQQFEILRFQINKKSAEDSIKLELERQNALIEIRKQANAQKLEGLDQEQSAKINTIESVAKPRFLKDFEEVDFEKEKQKQIIEVQKEFALKKLELKKQSLSSERNEDLKSLNTQLEIIGNADDKQTQEERKKVDDKLAILETGYQLENQKIVNETDKIINDLNAKRDELNKERPFSLREFFGLSNAEASNLQTALSEITSALDTVIQADIDHANNQIEESKNKQDQYEQEIKSLESKLTEEQKLNQIGKANNINRIQAEIKAKQDAKEQEAEIEKDALAKKKELQKQKLLVDSITQATNLITASTSILAQAAEEGGPVGVAIGIAAVAAMITAFTVQKQQALKAINEGNSFDEGGYTGDGGKYDIAGTVHKGEFVNTKEDTKQNRNLLEGIHQDDDRLMKAGILDLIKDKGIRLADDLPEIISVKKEVVRQNEINAYLKTDNSRLEKEMKEMKEVMLKILDENKEKIFQDQNGDLRIKKNTHTITLKKK